MKNLLKVNRYFIALLVLLIAGSSVVVADETKASGPKTVEINGAEIEYVEQGSGPLLILAHGAAGDYRDWMMQHVPALAQHFRVVSYSMRYHRSGPWNDSWPQLTLNLYADDLAAFIESFDDGPAHLVGWSMGASVAHTISLKHPNVVRSAYLYEGVADLSKSPEAVQEQQELSTKLLNPVLAAHKDGDKSGSVRALIDGVGGKVGIFNGLPAPSQKFLASKADAMVAYLMRNNEPVVFECDHALDSKVPTTLVVGTASVDYFQTVVLKHSLACFGEERITRIQDATHLWPASNAERFSASVAEFASKY